MPRPHLDHPPTPMLLRLPGAGLILGASLALAGCGASPPPKAALADAGPVTEKIDTGPSSYESEIGGMNEYAVEDIFKGLARPIARCFENGTSRVEALGGTFTVSFRVDRKGNTRWAYMKESTIGDRATETCVLDLVKNKVWPRPLSGEGLAQKSFDIEPASSALVLDGKRARPIANLARSKTASCRKGVHGTFQATAYLEPNGRVRAAGVAPPDEKAESVVDCLVDEIQKLKFSATGKLAKVTFQI